MEAEDFSLYPGGDLVEKGLADLSAGIASNEALLVRVAAPRLKGLGIAIPFFAESTGLPEHELYAAIQKHNPQGAYSEYNALIRRIVSFANSYGRRV